MELFRSFLSFFSKVQVCSLLASINDFGTDAIQIDILSCNDGYKFSSNILNTFSNQIISNNFYLNFSMFNLNILFTDKSENHHNNNSPSPTSHHKSVILSLD